MAVLHRFYCIYKWCHKKDASLLWVKSVWRTASQNTQILNAPMCAWKSNGHIPIYYGNCYSIFESQADLSADNLSCPCYSQIPYFKVMFEKSTFFKSLVKQSYTLKQTDYCDKTELLFNIFKNSGLAFITSSQLHWLCKISCEIQLW